jgi:hypothetical protein
MAVEVNDFDHYAGRKFGDLWKADTNAVSALLDEVCEAQANADDYKQKIQEFLR